MAQLPGRGVSLYYQIQEHMREQINSHALKAGDKLPSEAKLSEYFNVSRTTVRQAIDGLVESGLVERKQGSGTFVSEPAYARNRLNAQPNDIVCKYIYAPFIDNDIKNSFLNILSVNMAHILMLKKQNLLDESNTKKLLAELYNLFSKSPNIIEPSPRMEDYFLNLEQYIITKLGMSVGGKLQTARSRNDFGSAVSRMNVRDSLVDILIRVVILRELLLEMATTHRDYIMPGYTHLQPSQPTTLCHYLISIENALGRDTVRLQNAFRSANICPLGSCSFTGSSFPIDRKFTSDILGFSRPIASSLDAVASRDYMLEAASAFSILGSNINRFAEDLYIWSTKEFGYLEFDDSTCCCSTSMPQKKNALAIEHIKSKTSHLTGAYMEISMCLKGITYEHCRDLSENILSIQYASEQIRGILDLTINVLSSCTFNKNAMYHNANMNFITTTDLVDTLVTEENLSFRISHLITSDIVNFCIEKELKSQDITIDMVNEISMMHLGKKTSLTQEKLNQILSPSYSVENKKSYGSTSSESIDNLLTESKFLLNKQKTQNRRLFAKISNSRIGLTNQIKELIEK